MDRRTKYKDGLYKLYLPYYETLCALLPEEWQPYSGLRTPDEQKKLYALGRTQTGAIITNAEAGYSAHNYGCASDWTIFKNGKPVWDHNRWPDYAHACAKAGVNWGGEWSLCDKPHNELKIIRSYKSIGNVYINQGEQYAYAMIDSLHKT